MTPACDPKQRLPISKARKHPGDTQEAPMRHPGGTQEAPKRHPEGTQGEPRRHPGGAQGHPGGTQGDPGHPGGSKRSWEQKGQYVSAQMQKKWKKRLFHEAF